MSADLKQYIIQPKISFDIPADIKGNSRSAIADWIKVQQRDGLTAIANDIRNNIGPHHSISFIHDGSGYNVKGAKGQYCSFILIEATADAAKAIENLDSVCSVTTNDEVSELQKPALEPTSKEKRILNPGTLPPEIK